MTLLALAGLGYTLWHIWMILPLDTVWRIFIVGGCLGAFLFLFLNFMPFLGKVPLWLSSTIYEIGTSFIFILLYLVMIFVLLDLGRLVHLVPKAWLVSNGLASLCVLAAIQPRIRENVAEEFNRLEAPVYACFGNHEYYSGIPKALSFYNEAGINPLRDSVSAIGSLRVIGRDDRSNPKRKSLDDLMSGTADSLYTILLDHQPYHLEEAEDHGIDFQFSGHTHRGQIWPASWICLL